jgi:hypothetical protein
MMTRRCTAAVVQNRAAKARRSQPEQAAFAATPLPVAPRYRKLFRRRWEQPVSRAVHSICAVPIFMGAALVATLALFAGRP